MAATTHDHAVTARVIVGLEAVAERLRQQQGRDPRLSVDIGFVEVAATMLAAYSNYAQVIDKALAPVHTDVANIARFLEAHR